MGTTIATSRLVTLEEAGPDDEDEFLAAVISSRGLHHPWVDPPDGPERYALLLERNRRPEHFTFLVRERDGGVLAGTVNVTNIVRGAFQSAFCGYWAYAGSQGRGLMTDGLRSVVDHAFAELGLHRLEANIQPANVASIALAERCGFGFEGFSPRYLMVDGDWRDHNRYAITSDRPAP
jgi:[ribosomal protein S5]-alanine N-acetyltransferase